MPAAKKIIHHLHNRYPASLLALTAVLVILPIGLLSEKTDASAGEVAAPLELRLVAPTANAVASRTIILRGQLKNGDPQRVAFVIDGNSSEQITAIPRERGVWEAAWDTSSLANGDHTISFRAESRESSAMTGSVHVNVQNSLPLLHVTLDQPEKYAVEKFGPLAMHAVVPEGATDVAFLVSQVFVGKDGRQQVTPVRRFVASAEDVMMQRWSATTDPTGIIPRANGLFEVQALARQTGFSDTLSPGLPIILTSTSSNVSVVGSPQADANVNFLDVDISSPVMGASVTGTVSIVSAGTPSDAVGSLKVSVWDGRGYLRDFPATNVTGTWTATWETTGLLSGWYWIQSQAYGPGAVPSLSEPLLVQLGSTK